MVPRFRRAKVQDLLAAVTVTWHPFVGATGKAVDMKVPHVSGNQKKRPTNLMEIQQLPPASFRGPSADLPLNLCEACWQAFRRCASAGSSMDVFV